MASFLVRWHLGLLTTALAVALIGLPVSNDLNLDWSVEGMFPQDDPSVEAYRHLQGRFGAKDICLAVYHDPELWDASGAGLKRLGEISKGLAKVDGIQAVLSLSELDRVLKTVRGPMRLFANPDGSPLLDPNDKLAQALARVFENYTHRPETNYVAMACMLETVDSESRPGPSDHEATLQRIDDFMKQIPSPAARGMVTGEPVLVAEGFKMVQRDGIRLGITCSVIVSLVLLLCFRSLRWTFIPMAVVHWSLIATQASLVWLSMDLTMISSTLTSIVTVIGVATSIHLLLRFQEERRRGVERRQALESTLRVLLKPIFFACVTDAVGFCALLFANVGPVRDFGLMMAMGSMAVFFAIILVVPGLALLGPWDTDPRTPKLDLALRLMLRRVLKSCLKLRRTGLVSLFLVLTLSVWGSLRMQVESDFTKNFRADSPLMQGYSVIEDELGGAGVWDVMLPAPANLSAEYLRAVEELEQDLRDLTVELAGKDDDGAAGEIRLTKVLSIIDAVRALDAEMMTRIIAPLARLKLMQSAMPEFSQALLTQAPDDNGQHWLRIMLRSQEQVPAAAKSELVMRVQKLVQERCQSEEWKQMLGNSFVKDELPIAEVAGYHVMLGRLVENVLADQWRCFFIAAGGVFVIMCIAIGSWKLAAVTLIPNSLPILLVLGYLGWTGTRANMGVALIAAVSLGLSIDSSIHYLSHYRRRISEGTKPRKAMQSAQENVGLAALLATIALVAGFVTLCISEFGPTVVFGGLASVTLLGGLLGNLVILPLLIAGKE